MRIEIIGNLTVEILEGNTVIERHSFVNKQKMEEFIATAEPKWWDLQFINVSEVSRRFSEKAKVPVSSFVAKAKRRNGNKFSPLQEEIVKSIYEEIVQELEKSQNGTFSK